MWHMDYVMCGKRSMVAHVFSTIPGLPNLGCEPLQPCMHGTHVGPRPAFWVLLLVLMTLLALLPVAVFGGLTHPMHLCLAGKP